MGKSTLVDNGWVINPCLYALENKLPYEVIYLSFEIDRVSKEFDFCAYFLASDHNIRTVTLPGGVTVNGKTTIELNSDYLRGRLQDDNEEIIKVSPEIFNKIKVVYAKRIVPLFGGYDEKGNKKSEGLITFIEERENPTGLNKMLYRHAKKNGTFEEMPYGDAGKTKITGYVPNDSKKITLVVCDHLRKIPTEQGFSLKQVIDKYSEYSVAFKNLTGYSFVHIIHLNRSLGETQNKRFMDEFIHPTSDHIKDSSNLSEDADYIFTMFNPNDAKFNLTKHFNLDIKDSAGSTLYPLLRTIHLVESRHCFYPLHFRVNMLGNIKHFEKFPIKDRI